MCIAKAAAIIQLNPNTFAARLCEQLDSARFPSESQLCTLSTRIQDYRCLKSEFNDAGVAFMYTTVRDNVILLAIIKPGNLTAGIATSSHSSEDSA